MAGSISPYFLIVLLVSAFTMPLIFMVLIRNTARYGREPWHLVLKAFAWGAVFSVIIALIFSIILLVTLNQVQPLNDFLAKRFSDVPIIIGALIVAPIVEEAAKALGVRAGRPEIQKLLDGLVYGAAAGLGFSATENLFYGIARLLESGPTASLVEILIRSFSSSLLHASSTAVFGYGLAKTWLVHRAWAFIPYYLTAVIMHAVFNLVAVLGELYATQYGDLGRLVSFVVGVSFAVVAITLVRIKLRSRAQPM